jgi:hypothetical protein
VSSNTRSLLARRQSTLPTTRNDGGKAAAPAGGATAAAPEGGALGGPSALTPTSSWWALVPLWPCHAWHG